MLFQNMPMLHLIDSEIEEYRPYFDIRTILPVLSLLPHLSGAQPHHTALRINAP